MSKPESRTRAVLQGLLVTFLWSTSFVLIKLGLQARLPALTFAGLRYFLAFLCLAPFIVSSRPRRQALRALPAATWRLLAVLGVVYYALAQGLQFIGLAYLPAATVSLILNLTPLIVALAGGVALGERPGPLQWAGIGLALAGAAVYFLPLSLPAGTGLALAIVFAAMLANAGGALIGRHLNRGVGGDALQVTFVSMGLGSVLLLTVGLVTQGPGALTPRDWALVVWLAIVNTAVAFTLWNRTLRTLTAVESSILNCTMLPQIALLAWVFLGERLDVRRLMGLGLAIVGVFAVQRGRRA